tara:strand:+ start:2617 stop:2967 length:351 start_codon:yes stop_codon:yes gene_type:complete
MIEVISEHWDKGVMLAGVVLSFFGGRKTKASKEKKEESGALTSMQKTYNEFVIDQKDFVMEQRAQNAEIRNELYKVKEELRDVKDELGIAREEIKTWKTKYNYLKKQFETYKQTHP